MSNQKRRNPYILLGIPYGAGASEARRGFATKSRLVKRGGSAHYDVSDLTWALHELEQERVTDTTEIDVYRVPADPEVFVGSEPGLFNPPPEPFPIRSHSSREDVIDALEVAALVQQVMSDFSSTTVHLPDPLLERDNQ